MASKLGDQAEQFFQQVLETVLVAIPVDQDHPSVKTDIELNEETGTFVGEFKFPLAYGASKVSDHTCLTNGYSDLFSIVIRYEMCSNRSRNFLAVEKSKFELRVHTAPGIRFEYERHKKNVAAAHIHYTGVAGILSPALMKDFGEKKGETKKKGNVQDLHILVGGHRFRPSLEDFLYFIIKECGFVGLNAWENALLESRDKWFDIQLRAAVSDNPRIAAEELKSLGYKIKSPDSGELDSQRRKSW